MGDVSKLVQRFMTSGGAGRGVGIHVVSPNEVQQHHEEVAMMAKCPCPICSNPLERTPSKLYQCARWHKFYLGLRNGTERKLTLAVEASEVGYHKGDEFPVPDDAEFE